MSFEKIILLHRREDWDFHGKIIAEEISGRDDADQ
jgi:hypothetical protein